MSFLRLIRSIMAEKSPIKAKQSDCEPEKLNMCFGCALGTYCVFWGGINRVC